MAHQVNQTKQAKQTHQPTRPTRTIRCNRPTTPTRTIKPAMEIFSQFHKSKFTPPKAAPNCARLGAGCQVILQYIGTPPHIQYYVINGWPLIRTNVEINLSPQFTQVFLTTHNLSLSQTISYLGLIWTTQLSIGMTSLVVFNDCYNVDMLSLSLCLVGHNNIKSPLLVFVLKVTTSFRNT